MALAVVALTAPTSTGSRSLRASRALGDSPISSHEKQNRTGVSRKNFRTLLHYTSLYFILFISRTSQTKFVSWAYDSNTAEIERCCSSSFCRSASCHTQVVLEVYTMYTMYTKFQALINKDEAKKCFDIFQRQTAELQSGPTLEGLSKFQTRQTFRQMHIQSAYSPWSDAIRLPLFPVFDADVPALLAVASDAGPKLVWIGGAETKALLDHVGSCWIKIAQGMHQSCQTSFCSRRFLSCNWANNTRCW